MNTQRDATAWAVTRKPRDDELDVYGITHTGRVRAENQDHFLLCSLHKRMQIISSSLAEADLQSADTQRLAFLAMVADGVGGGTGGERASRQTLRGVTEYVMHSMHTYYTADAADDDSFSRSLEQGARACHTHLAEQAAADPSLRTMATTLTLLLGVWPRLYLLQVGDSRYYLLKDDVLTQVSRDQTLAQEMLDMGILKRPDARSRWSHILSSAIGGPHSQPVVTAVENDWGRVHLLCSDGLTKHVSDERIGERLRTMQSAEQVCHDLLNDALEDGGTDNITIIVGRAVRRGI
jgi:protein phosphatase